MKFCCALLELLYTNGLIGRQQTDRLDEANWHIVANFGCKGAKNPHRNFFFNYI